MLMRKEDKARWVAALRSGNYHQCEGTLTDGKGYCCLGVMEKVLGTGQVEEDFSLPSPQWCVNNHVQFDNQHEWEENESWVDEVNDDDMTKLSEMNDGKKLYTGKVVDSVAEYTWRQEPMKFPEIADWIEQNIAVTS